MTKPLIVRPPRVYLDTNHLINIAGVRKGRGPRDGGERRAYAFIDQCIRQYFGVVFNPAAPLDWVDGNATRDSAMEIAAVIDSAKLQYEIEEDRFVWTAEILNQCHVQDPRIVVPELEVLHLRTPGGSIRSPLLVLRSVPGYLSDEQLGDNRAKLSTLPDRIPVCSARDHVEYAFRFKTEKPHVYREREDGYEAALLQDIERAVGRSGSHRFVRSRKIDKIQWMTRFLAVDKVLEAYNSGIDAAEILRTLDLTKCPAVNLWLRAREYRIRAQHGAGENEVDDWMCLPVISYADLVLLDKGFSEMILQADRGLASKVTADPAHAARILSSWTTVYRA